MKDGFYKSNLRTSEEWHAGVKIVEEYFSYLKFLPGLRWISTNWYPEFNKGEDLDFGEFLEELDIEQVFLSQKAPPSCPKRDYNFMYHRGTYEIVDSVVTLSCSFLNVGSKRKDDIISSLITLSSSDGFKTLVEENGEIYTHHEF